MRGLSWHAQPRGWGKRAARSWQAEGGLAGGRQRGAGAERGKCGVSRSSTALAGKKPARGWFLLGSERASARGLRHLGSLPALLTRGPLCPTEASLGAAGASREEAELRAPAVPVPAGSACLLPLHPRALRALPGPLPLPAPEENAGKGFSHPTTSVSWESFRLISAQSCVCPDGTQLVRGLRCSGAQTAAPKGLLPPTYLQCQSQLAAELLSCDEGRAHAYKSAVL